MIVLRFDPVTGALLSEEQLCPEPPVPARRKRRSVEAMRRRNQKARERFRLKRAGNWPSTTNTTEIPDPNV